MCEVVGGLPRHRFHQRWVGIEQVCQEAVRRPDRDAKCGERREIEVLQVVRHQYAGRDRRRGGGNMSVLRVRNSDCTLWVEASNERVRKPRPDQGNGAVRVLYRR